MYRWCRRIRCRRMPGWILWILCRRIPVWVLCNVNTIFYQKGYNHILPKEEHQRRQVSVWFCRNKNCTSSVRGPFWWDEMRSGWKVITWSSLDSAWMRALYKKKTIITTGQHWDAHTITHCLKASNGDVISNWFWGVRFIHGYLKGSNCQQLIQQSRDSMTNRLRKSNGVWQVSRWHCKGKMWPRTNRDMRPLCSRVSSWFCWHEKQHIQAKGEPW